MSTQIDLGPVLSIPKGDWNAATTYERLNIVRHNSSSWICNVATSKGVEPTEDSTDWYLQVKDTSSVTSVNGMKGDVVIELTETETPPANDNSNRIATTEWVTDKLGDVDLSGIKDDTVLAAQLASNLEASKDTLSYAELIDYIARVERNTGMPMGVPIPYTGKDVPAGFLRADGAIYTSMQGAFPEFYEWVVNSGLTVPLADYTLVEGSCGYYGLDTSTGTVRMPTIAAGVFGTAVANQYGQAVQAGLPNISGRFSQNRFGASGVKATGPFAAVTHRASGGPAGDSSVSDVGFTFDASRANPVYGRSDTVQPSHVKYPWVIVVYNAAVPPSVAQAGEFIEMLDKLATALPTGTVVPYAGNKDLNGYLLCNGAAVSRTTYAKLFEAIGTTYGEGDGSTTFNLPNLTDRFIQGSGTAGTVNEAGLPEIKADFGVSAYWGMTPNGAISSFSNELAGKLESTSTQENMRHVWYNFSASRYSSVYGASTTVQPPALTMRYYIKY